MSSIILRPEHWVKNYADYLYNYTIVRVNSHEVAQDLISETFLAGLKSRASFKGEAGERTWLISILKRKIIDYYRKINSNKGSAEVRLSYKNDDHNGDRLEEQFSDPFDKTAEDRMENEELRLAILNCLETLPERQAAIFKLKTIEEVTTEEICNEFNITPTNFWVLIHRARKAMAECLEKNWL